MLFQYTGAKFNVIRTSFIKCLKDPKIGINAPNKKNSIELQIFYKLIPDSERRIWSLFC